MSSPCCASTRVRSEASFRWRRKAITPQQPTAGSPTALPPVSPLAALQVEPTGLSCAPADAAGSAPQHPLPAPLRHLHELEWVLSGPRQPLEIKREELER